MEAGAKIEWLPRQDRQYLELLSVLAARHLNIARVNGDSILIIVEGQGTNRDAERGSAALYG